MSRTTRAFRRNAAAHHGSSVEFAELLDAIAPATVLVADPVAPVVIEPAVIEPAPIELPIEVAVLEPVIEPATEIAPGTVEVPANVSRFADAGLDDDRLPIRSTARHSRRR